MLFMNQLKLKLEKKLEMWDMYHLEKKSNFNLELERLKKWLKKRF